MKKLTLSCILSVFYNLLIAQNQWFQTYSDSVALVKDANAISNKFIGDIKAIKPDFQWNGKTILDTSPVLIYYGLDKNIHLPLWKQLPPELKGFFSNMTGSDDDGKRMFGLFFNGFYLPHELGHAFQDIVDGKLEISYKGEYLANTISMLWLRKHGYEKELWLCYELAKSVVTKLPNPVPEVTSIEAFFTENYEKTNEDPSVYAYMQFKQFVQLYEDETLLNFDTFIAHYLNNRN